MSEHAILSPSSAHRWMRCPASIAASGPPKDDSNEYAREGTAAHTLAQRALEYEKEAAFFKGTEIAVDYVENGETKIQTFVVDEEMIENVQVYLDQVRREPGELLVEQQLSMVPVYGVEDQFGTGDAIKLDYEHDRLYVGDLKYGRGNMVFAENNEQLYSYGAAALREYEFLADWKTITVAIHQPRLNHYDEHTLTREELEDFIEYAQHCAADAMRLRVAAETEIEAAKVPGEKQCHWCPVKGSCAAFATWVHQSVFEDFTTLEADCSKPNEPTKMSGEILEKMWLRQDAINGWLKEIQAEAKRRLEAGMKVGTLKLVKGKKGPRQWEDPEKAEEAMKGARLKKDDMYSMSLISPTQAEKKLAKNKPRVWANLCKLIAQKDGAPSVALASDSRPPLVVATAEQFEDVSEQADDFSDLL